MKLLLDTGVVAEICHPRKHADTKEWLGRVSALHELLLSEVVDYELRRELLRIGARRSVLALDELGRTITYAPVTTATWRAAAALWARARLAGRPSAPADALDVDILIAQQAIAGGAVVVTPNKRHFEGFVAVMSPGEVPLR
jgi:predicted nucleic acid-binding protein